MTTMTTLPVTTTVTRTTTVELPNGETCELPWTLGNYTDVAVVELPDGGYRLGMLQRMEGDYPDPLDDYDMGERIDLEPTNYRHGWDAFTMDDACHALARVPLGQGRRVYLIDEEGCPGRDWTNMRPRWVYICPEDVPADQRAVYVEAVWSEWRAWVRGEVYGVCTVDVDADGTVRDGTEDACWGYIGYEHAENELQFRMEGE